MNINECIGKFVYGKDRDGYEQWMFNVKATFQEEDYGKALVSSCIVSKDLGEIFLERGGTEARWSGEFMVLEVFDSSIDLVNHIVEKIKSGLISESGYDPDSDEKPLIEKEEYLRLNLKTKHLLGRYISGRDGAQERWIFGFQGIDEGLKIPGVLAMIVAGKNIYIDKSERVNNLYLSQAEVYGDPQSLLENLKEYIKRISGC